MSGEPTFLGEGSLGRRLYAAQVPHFGDWPASIAAPVPHFVLFVAGDACATEDSELREFAHRLIDQGVAYLSAWGPAADSVHNAFDFVDIDVHPDPDDYLMTVFETEESLDEALWFALFHAWPGARYEHSCASLLAVAVGSDEWSATIKRRLAAPDQLVRDLGLDE